MVPGIDVKGIGRSVMFIVVHECRYYSSKYFNVCQPQLHQTKHWQTRKQSVECISATTAKIRQGPRLLDRVPLTS